MKIYHNKTLGSTLLVAGTQIGAGMLALPLTTGVTGFFCSTFLFICCFLFMLTSLFYLLEANLMTTKENANLISMVKERLGPFGQLVAWVTFLLLLYAVAAAYLSGGGSLISEVLTAGWETDIPPNVGVLVFLAVFGLIVVFGTRAVDIINRLCMFGLAGSFILLLIFVLPNIKWSHFSGGDPSYIWAAVPVVILSFTSHIIVPSLRTYLKSDTSKLKTSLVWGSVIPLGFYLVWQFLIIGMLPLTGEYGLESIGASAHPVSGLTDALSQMLHLSWIATFVGLFSFFALVTSFFGVSLSLHDFLADGFHIKKTIGGRFLLLVMMFAPPLLFAFFYPSGFILAIGYAGVFVAILYGILPVIMVWKGRYIDKKKETFKVIGGKFLMMVILVGSLCVIFFQVAATRGYLPSLG